jgi:hypothetical protein
LLCIIEHTHPFKKSSDYTVSRSHTKGWSKIFFGEFSTYYGQKCVFYASERLHTKNFNKIPISKKLGKNQVKMPKITTFVWKKWQKWT